MKEVLLTRPKWQYFGAVCLAELSEVGMKPCAEMTAMSNRDSASLAKGLLICSVQEQFAFFGSAIS
jgi:hypothetical protein